MTVERFLASLRSAQGVVVKLESALLAVCMLSMAVLVSLLLLGRYFNASFPWAQEATQYFLIYLVFWGASNGAYTESHIATTMFLNVFPQKLRTTASLLGPILFMFFGIVFGVVSLNFIVFTAKIGKTTATLPYKFSFVWILLPMCVSFFMISFHVLIQIITRIVVRPSTGE